MAKSLFFPVISLLCLAVVAHRVGGTGHTLIESEPNHGHYQSTIRHDSRKLSTPTQGDYRALIVLMKFTDHANRDLPPKSYFQTVCDGDPASDPGINSIMSMSKFFEIQSKHKYKIGCTVTDWIDANNTESFYADGIRGMHQHPKSQDMMRHVMNQVQAQQISEKGDTDWFSEYDVNKDGAFDALIFIHSGYAAEAAANDACDGTARDDRIQSKGMASSPPTGSWTSEESFLGETIYLGSYGVASAFEDSVCGSPYIPMESLARVYTNQFGVPDLFDSSLAPQLGGVGLFGLMAAGHGLSFPSSLSPCAKVRIGWGDVTDISSDGSYYAMDSSAGGSIYRITKGYPAGESLLIENRQKSALDNHLPDSGILIYHMDEAVNTANEETSHPGAGSWPATHYWCAVVQKDGRFDLEKGANSGDTGDYWEYQETLVPSYGDLSIQPNSDSYYNGSNGVSIRVMSQRSDVMEFFVSGIDDNPLPFPVPPPTDGPGVEPTRAPTDPPFNQFPGGPVPLPPAQAPMAPTAPIARMPVSTAPPHEGTYQTFSPVTSSPTTAFNAQFGVSTSTSSGGGLNGFAVFIIVSLISVAIVMGGYFFLRLMNRLRRLDELEQYGTTDRMVDSDFGGHRAYRDEQVGKAPKKKELHEMMEEDRFADEPIPERDNEEASEHQDDEEGGDII